MGHFGAYKKSGTLSGVLQKKPEKFALRQIYIKKNRNGAKWHLSDCWRNSKQKTGKQAKRTNNIISSWWAGGGSYFFKTRLCTHSKENVSADFHGHYRTQATPHSLNDLNTAKQRQYSAVASAGRAQLKPDGTRWRTVGEVKGGTCEWSG